MLEKFLLCEARPGLSGALFLFWQKRKKRERRTDKGAQNIKIKLNSIDIQTVTSFLFRKRQICLTPKNIIMSYTIIGIFPNETESRDVITKLENAGLYEYTISKSEVEALENIDTKRKGNFFDWLFDNDVVEKDRYEYASIDSNTITVYTETEEDANAAKAILDDNGAIDVEEKTKGYLADKYPNTPNEYPISESKKARIIAKAKNDLYFTDNRKPTTTIQEGMVDEMDSLGNKD